MKFDKFMDHCYKIMCIVVACVVAFGSVVSCFNKPVKACAIGGIDEIATFKQKMEHNYQTVLEALIEDLNNGNLDATSSLAKQFGRSVAMQLLFSHNLTQFYDPYFEFEKDWDDLPQIINISGSGVSGFYKYQGVTKLVNVYELQNTSSSSPVNVVTAPDFTIEAFLNPDNLISYFNCHFYDSTSNYSRYRLYYHLNNNSPSGLDYYYKIIGSGLVIHEKKANYSNSSMNFNFRFNANSIPSLSTLDLYLYSEFTIGGFASEYIMPDETVSTETPWDYYNNYLLPYLIQYFNDNHIENYDKYLIFPNGYYPSINPDPTEPGTMPSDGISIGNNTNIDIDINVYYPTDESGQPITDESGETVTETYYVTDTTPTDVLYKFTIPTLPNLDRYSDTLPPMNLAQFESGINFIFSAADGIFTDTGFLPVIIVTLSLCALCYVIWKIGG